MVRSSMFNKNPIFDRMDVEAMSERGGRIDDNLSKGPRSVMPPPRAQILAQQHLMSEQYSQMGPSGIQNIEDFDKRSFQSAMTRSVSTKKLKPINHPSGSKLASAQQSKTLRAQSLHFNRGLSYVMVKGKVQPSEKYIYRQMLPYTNADKFQQIQVKSSISRHQLLLKEMPAPQPDPSDAYQSGRTGKNGKKLKLKGGKMTKSNSRKSLMNKYGS